MATKPKKPATRGAFAANTRPPKPNIDIDLHHPGKPLGNDIILEVYLNKEEQKTHPNKYLGQVRVPSNVSSKEKVMKYFNAQYKGFYVHMNADQVDIIGWIYSDQHKQWHRGTIKWTNGGK